MTHEEAMQKIESPRFSAITNLASDQKTFLRIVADQPEVKGLGAAMKAKEIALAVLQRALDLAASPSEEGHEHDADAALAAYLWLLSNVDQSPAESLAEAILKGKHFWWARKLADTVCTSRPKAPGNTSSTSSEIMQPLMPAKK